MVNKQLLILLAALSLCSCRSINRSRTELGIPQSVVLLSFDDGPNGHDNSTARLLDVLKKYEVLAMFALLGDNTEHNPGLAGRIMEEGHSIVNHGYSDKWASKMGPKEFRDNLLKGEAAISAALGHEFSPKLYRPHGGFYRKDNKRRTRSGQDRICAEEGYSMIFSNVRVYDAVLTGKDMAKVVERVLRKVTKMGGGIILLHDARDSHARMEGELANDPYGVFNRSWLPEAVEKIIVALRQRGYTIGSPGDYFIRKDS